MRDTLQVTFYMTVRVATGTFSMTPCVWHSVWYFTIDTKTYNTFFIWQCRWALCDIFVTLCVTLCECNILSSVSVFKWIVFSQRSQLYRQGFKGRKFASIHISDFSTIRKRSLLVQNCSSRFIVIFNMKICKNSDLLCGFKPFNASVNFINILLNPFICTKVFCTPFL